jgi:hypothetical protein
MHCDAPSFDSNRNLFLLGITVPKKVGTRSDLAPKVQEGVEQASYLAFLSGSGEGEGDISILLTLYDFQKS